MKKWLDIVQMENNIEEGVKEFTCDFSKQRTSTEKTSWYLSYTKLTESIDEFNLSEESFMQANSNDINPIIYIRVAQGYKVKHLE